jgi:hypothetical protein
MTRSRLLLLLATILILAIYYAWTTTPRQQRVSERAPTRHQKSVPTDKSVAIGKDHLDFSGGETLPFKSPRRDLFRALYQPPKPRPQRVVPKLPQPPPPPQPVIRTVAPPPVAVTPPPSPGPKPIPALKVLGYLQKDGAFTVFLASPQGDIYVVRQGQRFADDLLVRELVANKIVISRGSTDPGLTLALGGAKPQRIKVVATPSNRPNVPTMQDLDVNTLVPENAADKKPESPRPGMNPAGNVNQADQ